jgi:hypothetical protein
LREIRCSRCDQPVGDQAYLCSRCGELLAKDLGDVPALVEACVTTYTRRDQVERPGGTPVRTEPEEHWPLTARVQALPWDERASAAVRDLRAVLVSWAMLVVEERGVLAPADRLPVIAGWLLGHVEWLRHHPAGPDASREMGDVVRRLRSAVDAPPALWFAGPCDGNGLVSEVGEEASGRDAGGCGRDVYAAPDQTQVACRWCGLTYEVDKRRQWLLDAAEDHLAHAELIGRAAAALGVDVTPSAIRGYAHRGRIVEHATDRAGRPLYRIGDVLDVARDALAARERKRSEGRAKGARHADQRRSA